MNVSRESTLEEQEERKKKTNQVLKGRASFQNAAGTNYAKDVILYDKEKDARVKGKRHTLLLK